MMGNELLEVNNVTKLFGATTALNDVSVTFQKGTVHSLVGRNGAGKTTLVNIIGGLLSQSDGSVYLEGKEISELSVHERISRGIRIVTQHASVIQQLSVAENIFLGLWPKSRLGLVDWIKLYDATENELHEYGLDIEPRAQVSELDTIDQRKINIVRAMFGGAKIIILDEPTTSLSAEDRNNLFEFIKQLKEQGVTFIFITHYLDEVMILSDEITVLRDGKAFPGIKRETVSEEKLANLITGENVTLTERKEEIKKEQVLLECKNISGAVLNNISFTLKKGEILGIVGFPGSGARELCRSLYGLMPIQEGDVLLNGKPIKIHSSTSSLKNGIVYIPNDRHVEGLVQFLSIRENISLPILKTRLKQNSFLLNLVKEKEIALQMSEDMNIKANSIEDQISSLSGGNQQKVVLSKVLACEPKILILDEPTVGIDIKSREEILNKINELTKLGLAAIYLTNDFDELLRITDRLLFFSNGKIIDEKLNSGLTSEDIIELRDTSIKQD